MRNLIPNGIKVAKTVEIFSLLAVTIAGMVQKVFLMVMCAAGKGKKGVTALPKSNGPKNNSIGGTEEPVYVLGCSATSAGDIASIYDREGYQNIYTGPVNDGVMPLDNSSWPTWTDVAGDSYSNNPLIASKQEVDGRPTQGTIDDYWIDYNSDTPDPYTGSG